ncbi:MAG: hypothetical protein JXB25_04305 [Deltaproteobacteria bacterium]|nr:hypothetical protein [Deltaproteobacteria bacterium]
MTFFPAETDNGQGTGASAVPRVLLAATALACAFLTASCSPTGEGGRRPLASPPESPMADPRSITAWVGNAAEGEKTVLDDPEFGLGVTVVAEKNYRSALDHSCRRARVLAATPPGETIAVCKEKDGDWFLAPRIWGRPVAGDNR